MSALEERRQRAREAFYDEGGPGVVGPARALEAAIETATRVRVTPDVLAAAADQLENASDEPDGAIRNAIIGAFEAAGFEVER